MDNYKFPYTRVRYQFTIAESCKKEDGYYHIFLKDPVEGGIKETVCANRKAIAEELLYANQAPQFLTGVDIYQFTSISITYEAN